MKYKTKLIFTIFLFPLLILTFAYLAFTTTFSLKTATIKNNLDIEKIKLIDATNSISVTNPEIQDNKIKLNISFLKENDYVEYEITVKNNNKETIEIKDVIFDEEFTNSQKLNYDITYEPSPKIDVDSYTKIRIRILSPEITTGSLKINFIL